MTRTPEEIIRAELAVMRAIDTEEDRREAEEESRRVPVQFSLSAFDAVAQEAAGKWQRRINWPRPDAILWIGGGSEDQMQQLVAYRAHFAGAEHHGSEGACTHIVIDWLGAEGYSDAARRLDNALGAGLVEKAEDEQLIAATIMREWPRSKAAATAPTVRPVSTPDLQRWVRGMLDKGHTGRELGEQRKSAFPGKQVPARKTVDDIYRDLFKDDFGELPRSGSPHPKLVERRQANGLA